MNRICPFCGDVMTCWARGRHAPLPSRSRTGTHRRWITGADGRTWVAESSICSQGRSRRTNSIGDRYALLPHLRLQLLEEVLDHD
jgi:hypothetical protein